MRGSDGLLTIGNIGGRPSRGGTLTGPSLTRAFTARPSRVGHDPSLGAGSAYRTITETRTALEIRTDRCSVGSLSPLRGRHSPQRGAQPHSRAVMRSAAATTRADAGFHGADTGTSAASVGQATLSSSVRGASRGLGAALPTYHWVVSQPQVLHSGLASEGHPFLISRRITCREQSTRSLGIY